MAIVHFVNYKKGTQSRAAMRGVMLYVMQEKKTAREGGPLVSGINCQPQSVYDDFLNTKLLYRKDGGVMFYHMVQSFPKGAEVDPRQAHEAARRLAEYFEGCEVLVCTHVDREHMLRSRQAKLKRDISLIDDILREGKMSEAHLRMLVEKILVHEEDGRLDLEIRLKAPFRDHLDIFENGAQTDCFPSADFDYDRLGAAIYGDYYAG